MCAAGYFRRVIGLASATDYIYEIYENKNKMFRLDVEKAARADEMRFID